MERCCRLYCVLSAGVLSCYFTPEEIEAKVAPTLRVAVDKVWTASRSHTAVERVHPSLAAFCVLDGICNHAGAQHGGIFSTFASAQPEFPACFGAAGHSDPCDRKGALGSEVQTAVCHQPVAGGLAGPHLQRRRQRGAGGLAGRPPPAPLRPEWACAEAEAEQVWDGWLTSRLCLSLQASGSTVAAS